MSPYDIPRNILSFLKGASNPQFNMEVCGRITSLENPRFFYQLMEMSSVLKK